jgi:hypothetical protein
MDDGRDKWWQIRLLNLLVSITFLCGALAFFAWAMALGPFAGLAALGAVTLLGTAVGALFGRAWAGFKINIFVFVCLLLLFPIFVFSRPRVL